MILGTSIIAYRKPIHVSAAEHKRDTSGSSRARLHTKDSSLRHETNGSLSQACPPTRKLRASEGPTDTTSRFVPPKPVRSLKVYHSTRKNPNAAQQKVPREKAEKHRASPPFRRSAHAFANPFPSPPTRKHKSRTHASRGAGRVHGNGCIFRTIHGATGTPVYMHASGAPRMETEAKTSLCLPLADFQSVENTSEIPTEHPPPPPPFPSGSPPRQEELGRLPPCCCFI